MRGGLLTSCYTEHVRGDDQLFLAHRELRLFCASSGVTSNLSSPTDHQRIRVQSYQFSRTYMWTLLGGLGHGLGTSVAQ
jgi:hypothetical protein